MSVTPSGASRACSKKSTGRPETTATRAKREARRVSSAGTPGKGRAATGSATMGDRVPSKSRTERAVCGISDEGKKDLGEPACAHRSRRRAQAPATKSAPATTTTSSPVTPATGTAAVNGATTVGLRPSVVAIVVAWA